MNSIVAFWLDFEGFTIFLWDIFKCSYLFVLCYGTIQCSILQGHRHIQLHLISNRFDLTIYLRPNVSMCIFKKANIDHTKSRYPKMTLIVDLGKYTLL